MYLELIDAVTSAQGMKRIGGIEAAKECLRERQLMVARA